MEVAGAQRYEGGASLLLLRLLGASLLLRSAAAFRCRGTVESSLAASMPVTEETVEACSNFETSAFTAMAPAR